MDLKTEILKEHSKNQVVKIARYIGNDTSRFKELMELFLRGEYRVTQRSSWVVTYCAIAFPELINPYFKQMINKVSEKNIHDAVKRNTVKIWSEIHIPEKYYGEIYKLCFTFLRSAEEPVAVKAHAMTVLEKISVKYPELKNELRTTIEDMMPFGKPAIIARGKKTLTLINKPGQ